MFKIFDRSYDLALKAFVQWGIFVGVLAGCVELARSRGALSYIYEVDSTKLSIVIFAIFIWKTLSCGAGLYQSSDMTATRAKRIAEKVSSGWLWSDLVVSIGMVGTVLGFIVMLSSFENIDFSNPQSIQEMITKLSYGMSTALTTTLVGLISSVLLKIQYHKLEEVITKHEKRLQL
mgnify:CR=1 FL=1